MVYFPSLRGEFIMDDWGYITQNPQLTQAPSPWFFWTALRQSDYWPLSYSFYWLFYQIFGQNSEPYHVVNFALHAANGVLFYYLARQFGVARALLASLIFLLHPTHVQAVAWIIQFKTLLSTALALGAILFFQKFLTRPKPTKFFWFSFALFAASILAKTSTLFLPVFLLFLPTESGPLLQWRKLLRRGLQLWPFFLTSLAGGTMTVWVNYLNFEARGVPVANVEFSERPLLAVQNLYFYLSHFFYPVNLANIYPLGIPSFDDPVIWEQTGFLLFSIFALWKWRKSPVVQKNRFFLIGYFVALGPCLGFVNIPGMKLSFVADHWTYWADFFLILICLSPLEVWPALEKPLAAVGFACVAPLGWISFQQAKTFASEEAFWHQSQKINPDSSLPTYNLGTVLGREGKLREAQAAYELAIRQNQNDFRSWQNLGWTVAQTEGPAAAIKYFEKAIELNPHLIKAYQNLSLAYQQTGHPDRALEVLQKALAENPTDVEIKASLKLFGH